MKESLVKISKFISLVLRHRPDKIGIKLDINGWCDVYELIEKSKKYGCFFNLQELKEVVETNEKQRFAFNHDNTKIRANQGHSISVDLELKPMTPPSVLYHGTSERFLSSILKEGIKKMNRQHVHLSSDIETARKVGSRHGKVVVLEIDTAAMIKAGNVFYRSENHVWLTDFVSSRFIKEI